VSIIPVLLVVWIIVRVLTLNRSFPSPQHWKGACIGFDFIAAARVPVRLGCLARPPYLSIACLIFTLHAAVVLRRVFRRRPRPGTSDVGFRVASALLVELPMRSSCFNTRGPPPDQAF